MARTNKESSASHYPPEEIEINVSDIARVIYRWRWLIVGGILAGLFISLIIDILQPRKYEYRTLIEIGRIPQQAESNNYIIAEHATPVGQAMRLLNQQQNYKYIEAPATAANRLSAIAHSQYQKRYTETDAQPLFSIDEDFETRSWSHTGIVEIRLTAPKTDNPSDLLESTIEELFKVHGSIVDTYKQQLRQNIRRLQKRLEQYSDFKAFLRKRQDMVADQNEFVRRRMDEAKRSMSELLNMEFQNAEENTQRGGDGSLYNDEINQLRMYIDSLHTKLFFDIPDAEQQWRKDIIEIDANTETLEGEIDEYRTINEGIVATQLILSPTSNGERVSPRYTIHGILGAFLGGFLTLIAAFVFEFWRNNKSRITDDQ